jgi:hypothetical protein
MEVIKTKVRNTDNNELKKPSPPLFPLFDPRAAFSIEIIKKINAVRIPAFRINESGESVFV